MTLDFRIDWGYQMLYSRRQYHPVYHWDGHLECSDAAAVVNVNLLAYPPVWWGPCHTAHETRLEKPQWRGTTRRKIAGIRIVAECAPDAVFTLVTLSGTFVFSAQRIMEEGRFSFPVGPKYGFCAVTVCRNGYLWYRPVPRPGQAVFEAADLPLPVKNFQRMELAELAPGKSVEFEVALPVVERMNGFCDCLCHLQAMLLKPDFPDGQNHVAAEVPLELLVNGQSVCAFTHYFRPHDLEVQMLEDVWARFPNPGGASRITLKNGHAEYSVFLSRVTFEQKHTRHLQLSLPRWVLAGEKRIGRIFAVRPDRVKIDYTEGVLEISLVPGWNDFDFVLARPQLQVKFRAGSEEAFVEAVYALANETPEVMVGYDMTVVPHDDSGFMDWLLDYTARTQLGNTVVFRNFHPCPPPDELLSRWGDFCRQHHLHVQSVNCHDSGVLQHHAGSYMHNGGKHEFPGVVYACDPESGHESADMKEAYERYVAFLKADLNANKRTGVRPAYGDASGGHRHCYLAGASFIRSETMVPHTQHLCSLARPAAEALGRGDWGVHIAIQHPVQLYQPEQHLAQYFLSLFQPWMMGASNLYEEDSLFLLFKEERQCWDDALTKGKRDLTRDFFRFVKTHPRHGRPRRSIAFLEGRYAAPFNGFICGPEQDPHYTVWGKFGNRDASWGHGQPEKCRHLLDVLMPGASTHPLRQRYGQRRFFFSGTPYGDFDQVPVEAGIAYLRQYRLLLNLGWNTMISDDYVKLKEFVAAGGTLFTGLPQFSTHTKRQFLKGMNDLALWNHGDLGELCGVTIHGKGPRYSGQWNAAGRGHFSEPELSRLPNDTGDEDGPCHLAEVELHGAEIVVWDAASGRPLVVRHDYGSGRVYLLCAWAYPGHEDLSDVAAAWMAHLAEQHRDDWFVEDASREVFWNSWRENTTCGKMMLLNTDWTARGNRKTVTVHTPAATFATSVAEREPKILTVLPFATLEPDAHLHLEVATIADGTAKLRVHGSTPGKIVIHGRAAPRTAVFDFAASTVQDWQLSI